MTFDVSAVVSAIHAVTAAALLIGAAAAVVHLGIGMWRYLVDAWESHRRYRGGFDDVD